MSAIYSQKFQRCIAFVIKEEGGFVNDPNDPGGATKFGVSIRAHRDDIGDLDRDGDIDAADVQLVSIEQAIEIYHDEYWQAIRGEELFDSLAVLLLDTAVNCGKVTAIKLLQRSVGVSDDGVFGPVTMANVPTLDRWLLPEAVLRLIAERELYYRGLKKFPLYGKVWLARLYRAKRLAVQMAAEAKGQA